MKKFSKLLTILLALTMILALASCGGNTQDAADTPASQPPASDLPAPETPDSPEPQPEGEEILNIGILKWVTHSALDDSEQGFVDALRDNGFSDGLVNFDYQNANDNASVAATIADRFVNNKVDLILAIATPAVQSVQAKTDTIPILGTAVTDFALAGLVESNEHPGGNVSGASDRTPVAEQFELLQTVLPDIKTVGIMYNSSEDNSRIQADEAVAIAENLGLTTVIKTFSSVNDIPQTAEALARECEAFWLPTDNTLSSAIGVLAQTATERKIPVVCGEEGMVHGGGTFTIGINYYNLGYQTGEMAVRILRGEATPADMPIEYQNKMAIVINYENAEAIGLEFPAEIIAQANSPEA